MKMESLSPVNLGLEHLVQGTRTHNESLQPCSCLSFLLFQDQLLNCCSVYLSLYYLIITLYYKVVKIYEKNNI